MTEISERPLPGEASVALSPEPLRQRKLADRFRSVAAVSATLVGTQAATSVLGLGYWTIAARQFSVSSVGVAGAAIALMMLLGTLGMLGLGTLLIAQLPKTRVSDRRLLVRSALVLAGTASTALGLAAALIIGAFPASNLGSLGSAQNILAFAIGTGLTGLTLVFDQAVLVKGNGVVQLERNVAASVVKIGALAVLVATGHDSPITIFNAWTIGNLVSLPLAAYRTRRKKPAHAAKQPFFDPRVLRGLGRSAASHHVLNLVLQAPLQLLSVVVVIVLSTSQNGYFSTAKLITGFVFVLPFAVTIALFATAGGSEREILDRMRFTIPFGLAASLLADAVLFPLAPTVLSIFGAEYSSGAVSTLRLLVLAGLPFVIKDHWIALRRVQGRTGSAAAWSAAGAVLELAAASLGAVLYGLSGLCIAWVLALALEAAILVLPLSRAARDTAASASELELEAMSPLAAAPSGAEPLTVATGDSLAEFENELRSRRKIRLRRAEPRQRTVDPEPTGLDDVASTPNRAGPVILLMSCGLLAMALCVTAGRSTSRNAGLTELLYWIGLGLIFLPATVRILRPRTGPGERLALSLAMPTLLQISRLVLYPTRFMFHDELIHETALNTIISSHHLFKANPLLPVTASYPGLESATAAIHAMTGLSTHVSAAVLLILARLAATLALIAIVERLSHSRRLACLAALIYACNPQSLFFNAQFSYQSLALPLAIVTAFLVLTSRRTRANRRQQLLSLLLPVAGLAATAVTHHLTSMLLVAGIAGWAVLEWLLHRKDGRSQAGYLGTVAGIGAVLVTLWTLRPGNPVGGYLVSISGSSASALGAYARGQQNKKLFTDSGGTTAAPWEQVALFASVILLVVALVPALWRDGRSWLRRRRALAVLLCLMALAYPLVPAGHLTRATAEVTDRGAGFLFLGVGFLLASWLGRRLLRPLTVWLVSGAIGVVFVGQIVFGAGPTSEQVPGPFLVSADARSIDADNIAAAHYLATSTAPGSRIYADRDAGLLDAASGGATTVTSVATMVNASRLLLAPTFTAEDRALIRRLHIRYVVVDERDSTSLPHEQFYTESGEYGEVDRKVPVSRQALTKLNGVPGVQRLYDNGSLVIYDVGALDG